MLFFCYFKDPFIEEFSPSDMTMESLFSLKFKMSSIGLGIVAQWLSACLADTRLWVQSPVGKNKTSKICQYFSCILKQKLSISNLGKGVIVQQFLPRVPAEKLHRTPQC